MNLIKKKINQLKIKDLTIRSINKKIKNLKTT